jgi:general secretion pathway protein I
MVIRKETANRFGLSLLEVLIALTIFLLGMVAIGRLVILAGDRALEVKLEGQATQLCQAKLAEVVAGVVPLSSQNGVAFDEDPTWQWSLDAEQDSSGLWRVKVTVNRDQPGGSKIECALSQFMLDPSTRGSTLIVAATPVGASGSSSGTSGSGSSSAAGSSGSGGQGSGSPKGGGSSGKPGPPKGGPAPSPSPGPPKGGPAPPPPPKKGGT